MEYQERFCTVCNALIPIKPGTSPAQHARRVFCYGNPTGTGKRHKSACQRKGENERNKLPGKKRRHREDYDSAPKIVTWAELHPEKPKKEQERLHREQRKINDAVNATAQERAGISDGPIFLRYMRGACR